MTRRGTFTREVTTSTGTFTRRSTTIPRVGMGRKEEMDTGAREVETGARGMVHRIRRRGCEEQAAAVGEEEAR